MKSLMIMIMGLFISLSLSAQGGATYTPPSGTGQHWSDQDGARKQQEEADERDRALMNKMKKIEFLIAFFAAVGQSRVSGQSESYTDPVTNVNAGVIVPVTPLSKKSEFITGLRFSKEGSKYKSTEYVPGGNSKAVENKVVLSYLRLPLFVRMNTNKRWYADAGVQPGVLLSAKDKHDGKSDDIKSDYNGFDMGLMFGVGYQFKTRLGASLNYTPGISNINKKGGPNDGKKDRNTSIALGVHYIL